MGIDFTLLSQILKEKKENRIDISKENKEWCLKLYNSISNELIDTFYISENINIDTIMTFIPTHKGLTFSTQLKEVEPVLKEMNLCQ